MPIKSNYQTLSETDLPGSIYPEENGNITLKLHLGNNTEQANTEITRLNEGFGKFYRAVELELATTHKWPYFTQSSKLLTLVFTSFLQNRDPRRTAWVIYEESQQAKRQNA